MHTFCSLVNGWDTIPVSFNSCDKDSKFKSFSIENDLSKKEIKMDKLKKVNYGKKKRKGTPGIELRQKVKKK